MHPEIGMRSGRLARSASPISSDISEHGDHDGDDGGKDGEDSDGERAGDSRRKAGGSNIGGHLGRALEQRRLAPQPR